MATKKRIAAEEFRTNVILNYASHLLPKEKFKNPLIRYNFFIKYGSHIDSDCYTPISQRTMDRIVNSLPVELQCLPSIKALKKEVIKVTKYYIHNIILINIYLMYQI